MYIRSYIQVYCNIGKNFQLANQKTKTFWSYHNDIATCRIYNVRTLHNSSPPLTTIYEVLTFFVIIIIAQ